jgi:hypothetical protein
MMAGTISRIEIERFVRLFLFSSAPWNKCALDRRTVVDMKAIDEIIKSTMLRDLYLIRKLSSSEKTWIYSLDHFPAQHFFSGSDCS